MKLRILFLCTGNSARSQMAEGLLRHAGGANFEVFSAGISAKGVHPLAIEAMKEIGIDITGQRSKDVRELTDTPMQFVVTVCSNAKEQCPIFPASVKRFHWDLQDPAAVAGSRDEKLKAFREIRDELRARIHAFVEQNLQFAESGERVAGQPR